MQVHVPCALWFMHRVCDCAAPRNRAKGGMNMTPVVASIMLGFLPLNHLMGRMGILQCMAAGGSTAFVRPPMLSPPNILPAFACVFCLLGSVGRES